MRAPLSDGNEMSRRPKHPRFDASDDLLDSRVHDELDLHGYSATEMPSAVRSFSTDGGSVGCWRDYWT